MGPASAPIQLPLPELAEQLSQALAHPVLISNLQKVSLRQLAGGRFTLYLVRPDTRTAAGFQQVEAASATGVVWLHQEFHCLLLGSTPRGHLVAIGMR